MINITSADNQVKKLLELLFSVASHYSNTYLLASMHMNISYISLTRKKRERKLA